MSRTTSASRAFAAAATLALAGSLQAALVQESFNTDTASNASTQAAYPNFTITGPGPVTVNGGVVNIPAVAGGTVTDFTVSGFAGDVLIQGDVGNSVPSGSFNVGLRLDGNRIVMHPGFAGPPAGAFRVEGPGGFGNTDMGFVPAGGVLHRMEAAVNSATGRVVIAVTDGSNPNNVFAASYINPAVVGANAGFTIEGGLAGQGGRYDNFAISQADASTKGDAGWVNAIAPANPLHWYRLDETNSNIAIDSGSAGIDAVYRGGVQTGVNTVLGGGARFDGVNDNVLINQPNLPGPWTAEFVLKNFGNATSSDDLLLGTGIALKLEQHNNTGQLGYTQFGIADRLFSPAAETPEEGDGFVHLVYVADPVTGVQVFLDGQLLGTNPNYIELPLATLGQTSSFSVNAIIDEFVVYNRVLTADEIASHSVALQAALVPEPVSALLIPLAAMALAGRRRRGRTA